MICFQNCHTCNITHAFQCCSGICQTSKNKVNGVCQPRADSEACPVDRNLDWVLYLVVLVLGGVTLLGAYIWRSYKQRKLNRFLSSREAKFFFRGDPKSCSINGYAHERTDNLPYNKELEIGESLFTADWDKPLGQGCYGLVLKGTIRNSTPVAAKTVRNLDVHKDGHYLRALMSEIKVLQYIGNADNIVTMVGCHTAHIQQGKVFLFLEFCPLGSLEKYLRDNKYAFQINQGTQITSYVPVSSLTSSDSPSRLTVSDMLLWSQQITNAMCYLADKKVIHADLATRNVLLLRKDCAKLTDFGLSRKLYDYSNYVKSHQEPLPWRWMSLESLQQLSFSHKSDVWGLGVTIWEIYSLGDTPYAGMSWNSDFVSKLEGGLRLSKPTTASTELYNLLMECWNPVPETRPNFREIFVRLNK